MKTVLTKISDFSYRWLPRLMCCHCRPDRSFHWRDGRPFPVCARCTGQLIGFAAAVAAIFFGHPSVLWLGLMLLPLIIDGFVQALTPYESTNWRRLITGVLFGYALFTLIMLSLAAVFRWGYGLGNTLTGRAG